MSNSATDFSCSDELYQIWVDDLNRWELQGQYSPGTQLLRNAAHTAEKYCSEYLEKKEVSQRGWKSRRELRG